ncbi:MAG: 30S ribosomal protein S24e [Euryarchaeota archaeon]|nr:30S ribosomal protein S24e [Euryarchaeota archaeon]|tara:strand:+ start:281 stop:625 length:345 start_codon:yes stop_codon:yes gene_type:complete
MEIKERRENNILNRVEIAFSWKHDSKSTPSRKEVMDLVQTLEPGANRDLIVIKNCETRFGQPLTTGTAYIYASQEAMAVEPDYIHKRHESLRSTAASEAPAQAEEAAESEGGDE